MTEFLSVTLAYPTVVFTVLLGVSAFYWLLVIVGAVGLDALDLDLDGADGAVDGAAEGTAEGAAEGADVVESAGIISSIFVTLKLRNAPMTMVLSVWILLSWLASYFGDAFGLRAVGLSSSWLAGTGLAAASLLVTLPITSILVRPFGRLLKVEAQTSRRDLVGKTVLVDTSRVDARFGAARAEDGGAGLIIQIRCDGENNLRRGSQALVLSYDEGREAYEVTPIDDILPMRLPDGKATNNGASEDVQ